MTPRPLLHGNPGSASVTKQLQRVSTRLDLVVKSKFRLCKRDLTRQPCTACNIWQMILVGGQRGGRRRPWAVPILSRINLSRKQRYLQGWFIPWGFRLPNVSCHIPLVAQKLLLRISIVMRCRAVDVFFIPPAAEATHEPSVVGVVVLSASDTGLSMTAQADRSQVSAPLEVKT
jgi:hypothetical protein